MPRINRVDPAAISEPTFADYLSWFGRRWWILAVAAVAGLVGAAVFTSGLPRTYTSSTSLLVHQIGPDANPNVKMNLDTEAQVVRSIVVATRAKELLRSSDSPQTLLTRVMVMVPPNAQVLVVEYEAATAAQARDGSHAFAQAYLDLRVDLARRDLDGRIAALRLQTEQVSTQLTAVAGKIAALPVNSADRQRAEADRSVLTNQLADLNGRLSPLEAAALDPGSIISDAELPQQPASPNEFLNLASGFAAGLLLGLLLALLLDRLDTRLRRGRDVTERLGLPVLLEITGRVPAATFRSATPMPARERIAREFGRLRNVLLATVAPPALPGGRQLLLGAATEGVSTGFATGNLAAAYARTGARTAVVTTNAASPLARIAGAADARGLADVLRGDVPVMQALTPVPELPKLWVLRPGDLDRDQELPLADLLVLLRELADEFDHVLIETPPATVAVEAQALASHVDGVVIVVEARRSRERDVAAALEQFEQVDAAVAGVVFLPHGPPAAPTRADAPRRTVVPVRRERRTRAGEPIAVGAKTGTKAGRDPG